MEAHVTDNVNDAVPPVALFQTPPRVPKDKAVPKPASVAASLIAPKPPCKPVGAVPKPASEPASVAVPKPVPNSASEPLSA